MRPLILLAALALPAAAQTTPAAKPATHTVAKKPVAHKPVTHKPVAKPVAHKPAPAVKKPTVVVTAAPFSQNPILQLRGNSRALLVFAPDSTTPALRQQMALLEHHTLELTQHDTIFVPVITQHHGTDDVFTGENLNPGSYRDQLAARQHFGLKYNDFAVILLNKEGQETYRSKIPMTVAQINAQNDPAVEHAELTQPH